MTIAPDPAGERPRESELDDIADALPAPCCRCVLPWLFDDGDDHERRCLQCGRAVEVAS